MNTPSPVTKLFVVALLLGTFARLSPGAETEILHLSGTGSDATVNWEFFCSGGRNSGVWTEIPVPSCWELQGFGTYNYGMERDPADEWGHYKKTFWVPKAWRERRIEIVFEGVMTDAEVTVNGRSVGPRHQGAFYRFEYDITELIDFSRDNLLEVKAYKRSSNPTVNLAERHADYWVFGGIFRPVYLRAKPVYHVEHAAIDAKADGRIAVEVHLNRPLPGGSLRCQILDASGNTVSPSLNADVPAGDGHVKLKGVIPGIEPWSAETPNLYRAEITLWEQDNLRHSHTETFGFRTIEVRPGEGLFINGNRVRLKGVNRHEFWPDSGRTVNERIVEDDVRLIKSMNMNAVRCSHYPPDRRFLEACDRLGLYVINERGGWQVAYDTEVGGKLIREMVRRDVNHPSIIFWANGNEGGFNDDLVGEYAKYDPQNRVVIHPWTLFNGIDTSHYETYDVYRNLAEGPNLLMPTEIWHGLYDGGHAAGLEDYWEMARDKPHSIGFFLWALLDEGVVRTDLGGILDVHGNFAPDGMVGPYRERSGNYYALRETLTPVFIQRHTLDPSFDGALRVENRFDFLNLNECRFSYEWVRFEGSTNAAPKKVSLASGHVSGPDVGPGESGLLEIPLIAASRPPDAVLVTATLRDETIMEWSFPFLRPADYARRWIPEKTADWEYVEEENALRVKGGGMEVAIVTGPRPWMTPRLREVRVDGHSFSLLNGPQLVSGKIRELEMVHYRDGGHYVVEQRHPIGDQRMVRWTLMGGGWIKLEYDYRVMGVVDYFGISFDYPEAKTHGVEWLGDGPYRVWNNRTAGGRFGFWSNDYNDTRTGFDWDYPEFKGYFQNMHWMALLTDEGRIQFFTETPDLYFRLFTPSNGPDPRYAAGNFPVGNISFLQGIAPIGTKFQAAANTGPRGLPHHVRDFFKIVLYIHFDPADRTLSP